MPVVGLQSAGGGPMGFADVRILSSPARPHTLKNQIRWEGVGPVPRCRAAMHRRVPGPPLGSPPLESPILVGLQVSPQSPRSWDIFGGAAVLTGPSGKSGEPLLMPI